MPNVTSKACVVLCLIVACAAVWGCDIYDDMSQMPQNGGSDNAYSYIDATSYIQWTYLNLEDGSYVTLAYDDVENVPEDWTFALHRYDCKTNGGAALETGFGSLEELESAISDGSYSVPADGYVCDVEDSIIIDMSHMMDGWLEYAPSMLNKELGKWLDVDISDMPPIYTPSGRVYIICTSEGTHCAVRFTGYTNPYQYDTKGYISLEYVYPIGIQE